MVPDGGWLISTAASLHRSCPRFHLVLLADTDTDRHAPHHQSSIANNNNSTPSNPPRVHTAHETARVGYVTYEEATSPVRHGLLVEILCLDDAARRSKRLACSARQSKRVQELAAARAAHYDGICLARWRRISVARAR